jgi:hypothetical protein
MNMTAFLQTTAVLSGMAFVGAVALFAAVAFGLL